MNKYFIRLITLLFFLMGFTGCTISPSKNSPIDPATLEKATFAGGCFWCLEGPFEATPGVIEAISGYAGGSEETATYDQVSSGKTLHAEAVQITFDPKLVSYKMLLEKFWRQIDPTDPNGQFVDQGPQYRTFIYYHDEAQKTIAEKSKADLGASGLYEKPIVTEIVPLTTFFPAEEYHQDFYKKSSLRYKSYREGSGRDEFIQKTLQKKLTPLQYEVTQHEGTEEPFKNEYWDEHRDGIYVDRVSGEPLFSSKDKYDSGTGWPSFSKPINPEVLTLRSDLSLFVPRTEIRSSTGNSHIGHVFNDGPASTGLRYCTNSAALRFILKEDLEKEGYGKYQKLFE